MRNYGVVVALCASLSTAHAQPSGPPGASPPDQPAMPPDGMPPQQPMQPMQPTQPQQPMQPQQPQPGSTHASFVSTSRMQWDVTIGEQGPACATPCQLWVPPLHYVSLHSHEFQPVRLDLGYLSGRDVVVRASPLAEGEYAAGITFTALSGMGLATGITLTAVGCSTDHSTMCTAGVITGLASAIGLYGSILLMRDALPSAQIGPASPYVTGNQVGLAGTF
jgi:hypothetical protein